MFTIIFDLYVFSNYFLQIYSEKFCFLDSFLFVIYSSMYTEVAISFISVRISDIKNPLLGVEEDFFYKYIYTPGPKGIPNTAKTINITIQIPKKAKV